MGTKLALSPEQTKAFTQLKTALTKCAKAGIYLWDDYGTISAVNGNFVEEITTDPKTGDELDRGEVSTVSSKAWHGSNADDTLYVRLR